MDEIMEVLRNEPQAHRPGPSNARSEADALPSIERKQFLNAQLAEVDENVKQYEAQIRAAKEQIKECNQTRAHILQQLEQLHGLVNGKGKGKATHAGINYSTNEFDWGSPLKAKMRQVFKINGFRLCQEGLVTLVVYDASILTKTRQQGM